MTLLVDEDGQGEARALHPPRGEPELVPDREEASEHLEAVAAARLLEDGDLVQIGGDGGGPASSTAAWPTWVMTVSSGSVLVFRVNCYSPMLVLRSLALCSGWPTYLNTILLWLYT